jgi:hypothetical protein
MPFRGRADPVGMRAACLALAGGALLASAGNAAAQLLPPLPPPPDLGGTIGDVTGLLGGSGSQPPDDGGTSGGSGGTDGGSGGASGGSGATSAGATATGSGGSESAATGAGGSSAEAPAPADVRAPRVSLTVVCSFSWIAGTGRLKARVTTDEPGSVTVGGTLRVGRKLVRLGPAEAAYPTAGAKTVTLALPRAAQHRLARVRSVRVSLQAVGLDASRNRAFTGLKRTLTRPREVAHLRHRHRRAAQRAVEGPR